MSSAELRGNDIRGRLVRIGFLVRLLALAFTILTSLVYGGDVEVTVIIVFLLVTSHLGLQHERMRALVVRHPSVALVDLLPVAAAPLLLGPDSPLSLVALSSALLIGVLFPLRTAAPLTALLISIQLLASLGPDADPVAALHTPVALATLTVLGIAVRRLSEQQSASEHQQMLATQAAAAARERLQLARDLHDTVAKAVQGVALTAAALPGWIERDPEKARHYADAVAEGARDAVTAARTLLTSLRLDDPERPLAEVVDELVYRWQATHGQPVSREVDDVGDLPAGHRHELVLALSEALENVHRHAPDAAVRVTLRQTGAAVRLTVTDDGPGFPAGREQQACDDGHFGLVGMRERLQSVTGTATIRSTVGLGTEVELVVPCDSRPSDPARGEASSGSVASWALTPEPRTTS